MSDELSKFKKVVLTWVYQELNKKYPQYFNKNEYISSKR